MDDEDKISVTGTFVPYDHVTSKTRLLNTLGGLLDDNDGTTTSSVLEAQATLREIAEDSALEHRDQPETTRLSWMQRLLGWFRR
jgi:hypothetical protein